MKKILTLCLICKDGKILLGLKKRGFGVGRWNGFGGKVEERETIEDAAIRELKEEVGLQPKAIQKLGVLNFSFLEDPKEPEVHIFKVTDYTGEPTESDEMTPTWFSFEDIPYQQMWGGDNEWFPLVINDKTFKGEIVFDRPSDAEYPAKVVRHHIEVIE